MSHVLQIISHIKCFKHTQNQIVQICVSSFCKQSNRLCCLQCVDESHCGQDHILISNKKFDNLLQQFHVAFEQRNNLNQKINELVNQKSSQLNNKISTFNNKINVFLQKQKEAISYDQIRKIQYQNAEQQLIRGKLNELVLNQGWMLQINIQKQSTKNSGNLQNQQQTFQQVKKIMRQKYSKLEEQISQILNQTQKETFLILQKQQEKINKLFHLFDQIKYKFKDNGNNLFVKASKTNKQSQKSSSYKEKKEKSYSQYLNDLCD